jgi:hypothetical protein
MEENAASQAAGKHFIADSKRMTLMHADNRQNPRACACIRLHQR